MKGVWLSDFHLQLFGRSSLIVILIDRRHTLIKGGKG